MRTKGIIAAGHEQTAEAAKAILELGGNAFDGALAAFIASFVAEPCMSSPGGGGFLTGMYQDKPISLDFFCQTPSYKRSVEEIYLFSGGQAHR